MNGMHTRTLIAGLALLLLAQPLQAQRRRNNRQQPAKPAPQAPRQQTRMPSRDSLKGAVVEVYQTYEPELKATPKPEFTPSLPPVDNSRPQQRYEVPQQTLYFTYRALPLRPLALGKDSSASPFGNYVKLGGGNRSTAYLDAGITALKGYNYESSIHLHHLSQSGAIQDQKLAQTGLEAEGMLRADRFIWNAGVEAYRNSYGVFGFHQEDVPVTNELPSRVYYKASAQLGVTNRNVEDFGGLAVAPWVKVSVFNGPQIRDARTFAFAVPVKKTLDSGFTAEVSLNGAITNETYPAGFGSVSNNYFQVAPALQYGRGGFSGRLGLYPTFARGGVTHLLPDIGLNYQTGDRHFLAGIGWQGLLRRNTTQELAERNPYLWNYYNPVQTRTDEVFAKLEAGIGSHLSFSGKVSWWQYRNLPLFLNDYSTGNGELFYTLIDSRIRAISLQAALRYQIADAFSVGVNGTWYNFYQKSYDRVWQEPAVQMKADLSFQPLKGLTITAYSTILDRMFTLDAQNKEVKLKGILDLGGGAEYQIIPRLSLWLGVNNILNNKYQRWYGYPVYGINLYGGLRFKF